VKILTDKLAGGKHLTEGHLDGGKHLDVGKHMDGGHLNDKSLNDKHFNDKGLNGKSLNEKAANRAEDPLCTKYKGQFKHTTCLGVGSACGKEVKSDIQFDAKLQQVILDAHNDKRRTVRVNLQAEFPCMYDMTSSLDSQGRRIKGQDCGQHEGAQVECGLGESGAKMGRSVHKSPRSGAKNEVQALREGMQNFFSSLRSCPPFKNVGQNLYHGMSKKEKKPEYQEKDIHKAVKG